MRARPTYIRFVVGADGEHHRALHGVFTGARALRDRDELSGPEVVLLEGSYAWFNEHLPVPPFAARRWPSDVVCWFKDDAGEPVRRMWDIVGVLREHDVQIRLLRSTDPGRLYYEDRFQVVVAEWHRL